MSLRAMLFLSPLLICLPPQAHAEPKAQSGFPTFSIHLPIELQWDNTLQADDPGAELADLYLTIEPTIDIALNPWLRAEIGLVFEPILDADPGQDRAFDDHGVFVETAQLEASFGAITINAGKFSAPFSIAFDYAPGIYGDALNADLELTERLGFGAAYNFAGDGTDQGIIMRGAVLTRDTSFLSGTLMTDRGQLDKSDGGAGNTEQLNTVAIALDVLDHQALPGVHLHAAYVHQPAGLGETADQNAYVVATRWQIEASNSATYHLLAEWAHAEDSIGFGDAIGRGGASQTDWTLAASGIWHQTWTAAIGFGHRDIDDPIDGDRTIRKLDASVGYFVTEDVLAEIAYLDFEDTDGDSQTLGLRLTFETEIESGS